MSVKLFFLVFIGGGLGAILRYLISLYPQASPALTVLVSNLIGCFLIGFICSFQMPDALKVLLVVGFLGGLTTFSSYVFFINEMGIFTNKAVIYILFNNIFGFLCYYLGSLLGPIFK